MPSLQGGARDQQVARLPVVPAARILLGALVRSVGASVRSVG